MEAVVEWLWDCYKGGALTEEETGLPLSKIGTREFLEKLLHSIAYREGFGDILAEGPYRASTAPGYPIKPLFFPQELSSHWTKRHFPA